MHIRVSAFTLQVPLLAAQAEGLFGQVGLRVEFERATNSREQLDAMLDGRIHLAHTAADNIAAMTEKRPGEGWIIHIADLGIDQFVVAGRDVRTWENIRGRSVGVDAVESGYALVLYHLLRRHDLPPGSYRAVPVGGSLARFEGLLQGELAVGLLNPGLRDAACRHGMSILTAAGEHVPNYPHLVSATGARTLEAHTGMLTAYAEALSRAVAWAEDPAHEERAVELLSKDRRCEEEVGRRLYAWERELRTLAGPTVRQAHTSLEVVSQLRRELTGSEIPVERYFQPLGMP